MQGTQGVRHSICRILQQAGSRKDVSAKSVSISNRYFSSQRCFEVGCDGPFLGIMCM